MSLVILISFYRGTFLLLAQEMAFVDPFNPKMTFSRVDQTPRALLIALSFASLDSIVPTSSENAKTILLVSSWSTTPIPAGPGLPNTAPSTFTLNEPKGRFSPTNDGFSNLIDSPHVTFP